MSTATSPADILDRVKDIRADTAGVMEASRWAEWVLAQRFKAEGTGIHSRLNAVQHLLPPDLVADLRYLASVRNDFAHNPMATVRQPQRFTETAQRVLRRLLEMPVPTAQAAPVARTSSPSALATLTGLPRMIFVACVAGFWALAVLGLGPFGRVPHEEPVESPAAEVESAEPDDASPRGRETRSRAAIPAPVEDEPAGPVEARPETKTARAPRGSAPASARSAQPADAHADAKTPAAGPDDTGLSLEDLRKLKGTL